MTFVCPTCKVDCRPIGTNVVGIGVEEYNEPTGWKRISRPFETKCLAIAAMREVPDNRKQHRVYSVIKIAESNLTY